MSNWCTSSRLLHFMAVACLLGSCPVPRSQSDKATQRRYVVPIVPLGRNNRTASLFLSTWPACPAMLPVSWRTLISAALGLTDYKGYLAHKKTHPPRTLPWAYAQGLSGISGGWAFSYG